MRYYLLEYATVWALSLGACCALLCLWRLLVAWWQESIKDATVEIIEYDDPQATERTL